VAEFLDVAIAGEPVRLLCDRALYWPARRRLFIADLHLGKGDTFRSAGIALPSGGTRHDLARIGRMVDATGATSLWVLGDFLHAAARERSWRDGWDAWRARREGFAIGVLAGNHDRALAGLGLAIELLGDAVDDGPFSLRHAPDPRARAHVLCGHLHPTVRVGDVPRRWPAFWLRDGSTVLPAFSQFTGGRTPSPLPGEALVACVEGHLVPLPRAR
jgi:uncharacterized protein